MNRLRNFGDDEDDDADVDVEGAPPLFLARVTKRRSAARARVIGIMAHRMPGWSLCLSPWCALPPSRRGSTGRTHQIKSDLR